MSELFMNKYRIPSNRLRGWDYARNGAYFITIVTHGRRHLFGEIKDGKMILNDIGKIVHNEFFKSFEIRDELFMGNFILMPNHLHAIIILDNSNCVSTTNKQLILERRPKSISSFVAAFKSSAIRQIDDWIDKNNQATKKFNKDNPLWQANYHDHIIRNSIEYHRISEYISNNPKNWG